MFRWVISTVLLLIVACGDNLPGEQHVDEAPVVIEAPATVRVVEGETASFVITLADDPGRHVTIDVASRASSVVSVITTSVTLSSATYASGVMVEVRGTEDDSDIINDTADLELSFDGEIVHRVVATVVDNDFQQILTDTTSLTINEGYTASFTVRLVHKPPGLVTLKVASTQPSVATASPAMMTFSAQNYATPQVVTVMANRDQDTADGTAMISIGDLPGVQSPTVTANVRDVDAQRLVLSAGILGLYEGGSATFSVALAYDPLGPVAINLSSSMPSAVTITSASQLAFDSSNYSLPQTVSVTTYEDADTADEAATLTLTGPPSGTVNVAVTDNDQLIVPNQIQVGEGLSTTFTVKLANDPGSGGRVVEVQVVSGDASVTGGTLTFYSQTYATGLPVTVNGLVDPYSTSNKTALLRVSSPGQVSRDVAVTVQQRIPGYVSANFWHEITSAAGDVGWMTIRLTPTHPLPGDGQIELNFPAGYDVSSASLDSSNLDGTLSLVATTSKLVVTRSSGTASGSEVRLRFASWRNPPVSGNYAIAVATRSATAVPIDQGTATDWIDSARISATVTFATLRVGASGAVTFTFTTRNPWPADGASSISFPSAFGVASATVIAQSGVDGVFTRAPFYSTPRFVRSGGTTVPAGTSVSITLDNVTNPASDMETSSFWLETFIGAASIDTALIGGVIIGCPPITRSPRRVYSVPAGTSPWQWSEPAISWGYPATATAVDATDILVVDDYRFAVPESATVTGIRISLNRLASGNDVVDSMMRLVKAGTIGTTDRSSTVPWVWWASTRYGGMTDLWGDSWSTADVLSSTFGVAMAARAATPGLTGDVGVGIADMTIYFSCSP